MANSIIVYSSARLDAQSLSLVKAFAKSNYQITSPVEQVIDPSLIAGFKVNINGIEHDFSVAGELARLGQAL